MENKKTVTKAPNYTPRDSELCRGLLFIRTSAYKLYWQYQATVVDMGSIVSALEIKSKGGFYEPSNRIYVRMKKFENKFYQLCHDILNLEQIEGEKIIENQKR